MAQKFRVGDRVIRAGVSGPHGTVKKVRVEVLGPSLREAANGQEPAGVTVTVLWDNGTMSHLIPDGLETIRE